MSSKLFPDSFLIVVFLKLNILACLVNTSAAALEDDSMADSVSYPKYCQKYHAATDFAINYISNRLPDTTVNLFFDSIEILNNCNHEYLNINTKLANSYTFTVLSSVNAEVDNITAFNKDFRQRSRWFSVNIFILMHQNLDLIPRQETIRELDYNFLVRLDENNASSTHSGNQSIMLASPFNKFKFKAEVLLEGLKLQIISICFYCNNGGPRIETIFEAPSKDYEAPEVSKLFPDFTKNFHGRQLVTMAGKGIQILNRIQKDETGNVISRGGFQMTILESLEKKLNFGTNISESSFGSRQADTGLYDGMIGEVQVGRAELGVGAAVTSKRRDAVFFLAADTFQFITFVTTKPNTKTKWQAIFRSFAPKAWSFIGVTCCCLGPVYTLAYIGFHTFKKGQTKKIKNEKRYQNSLFESIGQGVGFIIRPLLEQPFSPAQMFRSSGGAILLLCWMFSAIIFGTAYKSILMTNMVSPLYEDSPETYAELAAAKEYKIYLHYVGGTLPKLFHESPNPVFQDLSKRLILEKSIFKCIENTLETKAACLSYRDNVAAESNRNFSDRYGNLLIKKSSDTAFNLPVAFLLPKDAVYKESMNSIVRQQVDMGLAEHYLNHELNLALDEGKAWAKVRPDAILENKHNGPVKLSLDHFLSSFGLLGFGLGLGFVVFLIEHIMNI